MAEELEGRSHEVAGTDQVIAAGSLRRWGETCKDIDLVAASTKPAELTAALASHPLVESARKGGTAGTSVTLHTGVKVDLRVTKPETFGNLLQHFTGSMEHNVEIRERALKMGLSVSENGIKNTKTGKVRKHKDETAVYKQLKLPYIPPEIRLGSGEIAAADEGELPDWSRSRRSRATCTPTPRSPTGATHSRRWRRRRRSAATPTSRSPTTPPATASAITSPTRCSRSGSPRSPRSTRRKKGFRLLAGSEVNIGTKGELDYPDALLKKLDWVIASVHTSFRMSEKNMTERVVAAIEHPLVDCIGHLTGRMLLRREPYGIDVEKVFEAAAANGDDDRDQRQPQPPRPIRPPRPARGTGRGDDLPQHRRPRNRDPRQHALRGRHRAPRLARAEERRQHPDLGPVLEAAQTGALGRRLSRAVHCAGAGAAVDELLDDQADRPPGGRVDPRRDDPDVIVAACRPRAR